MRRRLTEMSEYEIRIAVAAMCERAGLLQVARSDGHGLGYDLVLLLLDERARLLGGEAGLLPGLDKTGDVS